MRAARRSAICNVSHPMRARLAGWLLRARELLANDELPVLPELLWPLMGASRRAIEVAACSLEEAGLIKQAQGFISVRNSSGLRSAGCGCQLAQSAAAVSTDSALAGAVAALQ
jgi:hypothetical protein